MMNSIPEEFKKATAKGGLLTVGGCALGLIIMVMEMKSLFDQTLVNSLTLDTDANSTAILRVDVTMHQLQCKYMTVTVNDAFGTKNQDSTALWVKYSDLDENGREIFPKKDKDEREKTEVEEKVEPPKVEEEKELDSDWASSSDGFKHRSFDAMIKYHDFHFVNFFAGWCHHCRAFSPVWKSFADEVDMKPIFKDRAGRSTMVKLIKVNCVDFDQACASQRVGAYPTIRFYTKEGNWREYDDHRDLAHMRAFLEEEIRKSVATEEGFTLAGSSMHTMKARGCRVRGDFHVPRVPGEFHLMATGKGTTALDPRLTNVSHTVTKMGFVGYDESTGLKARIFNVRQSMKRSFPNAREKLYAQMAPLDGQSFPMLKQGHSLQHYMRVVMNRWIDGELFFTFTSADRASEAKVREYDWYFNLDDEDARVPQAKFFYDIEPVTLEYRVLKKSFREVLSSIVSLLGALFIFMRTADVLCDVSVATTKKYILKERRRGGHLD